MWAYVDKSLPISHNFVFIQYLSNEEWDLKISIDILVFPERLVFCRKKFLPLLVIKTLHKCQNLGTEETQKAK